jgi:hypothetical protein
MFGRKIAPMIKKAVASGAATKAAPRGRGLAGVLQEVVTLASKKIPAAAAAAARKAPVAAAPRGGMGPAAAQALAKKAVSPMMGLRMKKGGAVKKSSDAMGRAVKRKTADVKGRAMKKGK